METQISINSIRSFLVHLPRVLSCKYNEAVSYLIWKVLNSCLRAKTLSEVNWGFYMHLLSSNNWYNGAYSNALDKTNWKQIVDSQDELENLHVSTCCNRQCYPTETIYYCFTCTMNPLYEVCELCFDKSKHEGHSYVSKVVIRPEGRVCHCGDFSVFKKPEFAFKCKNDLNNQIPNEEILSGYKINDGKIGNEKSDEYDEHTVSVLNEIIDYMIDVTVYFKELSSAQFIEEDQTFDVEYNSNDHEKNNKDDNNNESNEVNSNPHHVRSLENKSHPKTFIKDSKDSFISSYIGFENDFLVQDEVWALQIEEEHCNINYFDLMNIIANIMNKPIEYAISMTEELEKGKKSVTITHSKDIYKLKKLKTKFESYGVKTFLRKMSDIFKQDLIEDLTHWLYNICTDKKTSLKFRKALRISMLDSWDSNLLSTKTAPAYRTPYTLKINLLGGFLIPYEEREAFPEFCSWGFSNSADSHLSRIMLNYDKNLINTHSIANATRYKTLHGSRFQYFITECTEILSKVSKYRLLKIVCTLFTIIDPTKKYLAAQYIDVYLSVLYSTVASDNSGFKVSLMSTLSQYTFQDPEIANMAIRCGFIERTLRYAFTLMAFNPEDLLVYLPIALSRNLKLPLETIKNRKTIICFKDLCVLISTNTIPEELLQNDSTVNIIIECMSQFNNILPLKRETSEHVEFENFDFSSFYFFFPSILIMTDSFIRSLSLITDNLTRKKLVNKLACLVMNKELELLSDFRKSITSPSLPTNEQSAERLGLMCVKEKICNYSSEMISFKVGVDIQNFFNPMSYLFKFILQWSQCGRYEPLPKNLRNSIDFDDVFTDKQKCLFISESALSTLVLIGQINVGFWVRNGAPVMHQMKMYTKYNMREFTYFSDIFNVQFSMSHSNPDDFMATYLSRWGLKNWANGVPMGDYPDFDITIAIVNQSILLLVQLLTDVKSLIMLSSIDGFERILKTEIVHSLCFQNSTYSQIMNSIPEYITKHVSFDLYLNRYSDYCPPTGLTDSGVYSLNPKYLSEVDPYYIGLSSSRRYEAEKCVRTNLAKEKEIPYESTYIPAKKVNHLLKGTAYSQLYNISCTDTFGIFLKHTLDHIIKFQRDSLLPVVVHLIHLCVVNNLDGFTKIFWREYALVDPESCHYHSIGSNLFSCLLDENYLSVHGKVREIFRFMMETAPHINVCGYLQEQTPSFKVAILWSSDTFKASKDEEFQKKKNTAKLREKKMLKRLAKQQQKFIENNSEAQSEYTNILTTACYNTKSISDSGWNFPDDLCVFCKMSIADDVFVYFSYQENNICDYGLDFSRPDTISELFSQQKHSDNIILGDSSTESLRQQKLELTTQKAVLRTCGHGSHISCLKNHMKSISSVHNQTTKNIPVSFGFGLTSCPLCNGLCNSFLPQVLESNNREFFKFLNGNILSTIETRRRSMDLLVHTSLKAASIFQDLYSNSKEWSQLIDVVDDLMVNTTSNIELALRSNSNSERNVRYLITNQKLLTLRLLADLKMILTYDYQSKNTVLMKYIDRDQFISENLDTNILQIGSQIHSKSIRLTEKYNSIVIELQELFTRNLHQNLIVLARELTSVNFYQDISARAPWNIKMSQNINSEYKEEVTSLLGIFKEYCTIFNPSLSTSELKQYDFIKYHIHFLIINSVTVFLRRLSIISYSYYAVDIDTEIKTSKLREIDVLLHFFTLNKFSELLMGYYRNDLGRIIEITQSKLLSSKIENSENTVIECLKRIKCFNSFNPPYLIELKNCLSSFFVKEETQLMHKVIGAEIAYCLFCGAEVHVQKLSALHRYLQGECTNHVRNECTVMSAYGVFLMIRSNTIYLSYGQRGSFYPAPYLNRHGESDEELKYNAPVYLNEKRYNHLINDVILGNLIPHIVFRLTDSNSDLGGWETI